MSVNIKKGKKSNVKNQNQATLRTFPHFQQSFPQEFKANNSVYVNCKNSKFFLFFLKPKCVFEKNIYTFMVIFNGNLSQ